METGHTFPTTRTDITAGFLSFFARRLNPKSLLIFSTDPLTHADNVLKSMPILSVLINSVMCSGPGMHMWSLLGPTPLYQGNEDWLVPLVSHVCPETFVTIECKHSMLKDLYSHHIYSHRQISH